MSLTNKIPAMVCAAAIGLAVNSAAADPITFCIDSLTGNNVVAVNHQSIIGDDRGGIALSQTGAYYTGDSATVRHDQANIANQSSIGRRDDGIVYTVGDKQLYSLGTSATTSIQGFSGATSTITHLRQLDDAGQSTGTSIALSQGITLPSFSCCSSANSGVFAGWDSVTIFAQTSRSSFTATGDVFKIDVSTGNVSNLGSLTFDAMYSENWAFWGVAEFFGGEDYLTYVGPNGDGTVRRTRVSDGTTTTIASFGSGYTGLSDMATIAVDPTSGRWYWHAEGTPQFAQSTGVPSNEVFGYADATFTVELMQVPEPGTLAFLGLGLAGIGYARRKRAA